MELLLFCILIISIIILSGLISGSEAALLSVSYTKSKEILSNSNDRRKRSQAEKLLEIKENIQKYITTIVVMNNIVNIVGSVYVGVLTTQLFGEIYIGLVSGLLTFFIIMFAEIIPKIYGEKYCETISLKISGTVLLLTKILTPMIFILNKISALFVKSENKSIVSEGEIKEMAVLGQQEGSINSYESKIIKNVFEMNDIEVDEIMIPKNKTTLIEKTTSYEEIIDTAQKTGYTRFPVSHNHEIIGVINAKDLFKYYGNEKEFSITKILRPVIYAPESMKLSTLERKLKKNRTHMAIIVNEHGDFTGIVTLEDIIEEVLGDIEDEFDKEKKNMIKKVTTRKFNINSACDIPQINETLDLDLPENDDYNTLNGFLTAKLDRIPRVNNKVEIEEGMFRIISASKKKALLVEFKFNE